MKKPMNQPLFQAIESKDAVDIVFTDIRLHVAKPRKPAPLPRAIAKSVRNNKPGRAFTTDFSIRKDGGFEMSFPTSPEIERVISEAESRGKTVRFMIPKEGISIFSGKDLIENLISKTERRYIGKNV